MSSPDVSRAELAQQRRRKWLPWLLRARALDPRVRRDPDFIVVGAQKAGSTSLFAYLADHPDVDPPLVKEIHYFTMHADRGQQWYRRHFPLASGPAALTGEASPFYMVHPLAMQRIASDLPRAKVIAILRHPVERLVSHYRHSVKLGHEALPLDAALAAEEERIRPDLEAFATDPFHRARALQRFTYLTRSLYSPQVARIQELFPQRHLFLRLEDLTDGEALRPLCDFLGIDFRPETLVEARNVNAAVPRPDAELIDEAILDRLRADASTTCALLGWEPWDL